MISQSSRISTSCAQDHKEAPHEQKDHFLLSDQFGIRWLHSARPASNIHPATANANSAPANFNPATTNRNPTTHNTSTDIPFYPIGCF